MSDTPFVILNPEAGNSRGERSFLDVLPRGADLVVHLTGGPGDGTRLARRAVDEGHSRIVVGGGDGTINEVLNGLAPDFDAELAILPLGTGNDFARAAGIPEDAAGLRRCLEEWRTRSVDVALLRAGGAERWFLNTSAGGFSTRASDDVDPDSKELWGSFAYYLSAARKLPELSPHRVELTLGDRKESFDVLSLVVANGRFIGGGLPVAPDARLDDGELDVLVVPEMPRPRLLMVAGKLLAGDPGAVDELVLRRAPTVELQADPPFDVNADGETVGATPARYELRPRALEIVVAPGEPSSRPGTGAGNHR